MVKGVAREGFDGNGDSGVIHKEFFFDYISTLVKDIVIRLVDFTIEVGHIIINDLGGTSGFFGKVCIDPADDHILIGIDKIRGIKNSVRIY